MLLYFAYGSNLLPARLRERVPSARVACGGVLQDHALRWHKRGQDGSGKCDVVRHKAACVHGVLYRLNEAEKPALDRVEGLGQGYDQRCVEVITAQGCLQAWTYVATDIAADLPPWCWYHALVVHGARAHDFPLGYINELEAVVALPDPNPERVRRHAHLLRA